MKPLENLGDAVRRRVVEVMGPTSDGKWHALLDCEHIAALDEKPERGQALRCSDCLDNLVEALRAGKVRL